MISVLIADDHNLIREGFRKLIDREPDINLAGEAKNAEELFLILTETQCNVVVLDISLPDKNGIEVLKDLKIQYPHINVLILSMHPEERYASRALKSGASGYMTKDSASDELINAVRKVNNGGRYISSALAEQLASTFADEAADTPHTKLSDREYQVFLLIGEGKTVQEISERLSLSVNTINTYRRRILEKMNVANNADIVQYALRHRLIE